MSILLHWLRRLWAPLPRPSIAETMSLQDWADLPAHHPDCTGTPC